MPIQRKKEKSSQLILLGVDGTEDDRALKPYRSFTVHFRNLADRSAFGKLIGQKLKPDTKLVWFPEFDA